MDLEHPTEARICMNFETIAALTNQWKSCFCFRKIMTVKTVNTFIQKEDHDIPVRVYLPEGEGPHKVLVFYHGGGWSMNTLDVYDFVPRYFAKYGNVLVVTPEYRLAPEHKFPKGWKTVMTHSCGLANTRGEYGGSPGSISVCGDSAGGNFAAAVSLMARDRKGPEYISSF